MDGDTELAFLRFTKTLAEDRIALIELQALVHALRGAITSQAVLPDKLEQFQAVVEKIRTVTLEHNSTYRELKDAVEVMTIQIQRPPKSDPDA